MSPITIPGPIPAPVPLPPPSPVPDPQPVPPVQGPFHLPQRQDYAIAQERMRHNQALYAMGEYAVFVLMWNIVDFDANLVERCSTCFAVDDLIASVYNQPTQNKCPDCFGTTFEGGYKAILVRPSIWDTNEEDYRSGPRGEVITQTSSVQSTSDFRLRTGDYVCRGDGSRYQMRTMSSNELRTGFAMPTAATAVVGYNYGTVSREDESSVAFLLPPSPATLVARLAVPIGVTPTAFADIEVVRGPVLA